MFSTTNARSRLSVYLTASAAGFLLSLHPSAAAAQVALSAGVQEVYDDNVFLEDDQEVVPPPPQPGQQPIVIPETSDGDPNDDFITHAFLGVSGALPIHPDIRSGIEARGGAMFFADQDDESRFTLDSVIKLESLPSLLPEPFFAEITSDLNSGSNDISVAEGTAARQSQTHTLSLGAGVRDIEVFSRTDWAAGYRFARHDFLGEWTFSERDSENRTIDQDGSDYFSNGISTGLTHHMTQQLDLSLTADATYLSYTQVDSNDVFEDKSSEELDRIEYNFGGGFAYLVSDKFDVSARAGVDLAHYTDDPQPQTIQIVDENGNVQTVTSDPDDSQASFAFDASANYRFDDVTGINASANQSASSDIDGDRIVTRTFALNASRKLGENLQFMVGGRYTQFSGGDSLSGASDRYDVTTSAKYALTKSIALAAGWNYVNQAADEDELATFILSEDYESHRFFISITAGLLGLTS